MNLLSQLIETVRSKGIKKTASIMLTYIDDLAFDIKYHTDTLRWQDLRSLDVVGGNKDHGVFYQPTQARTLRYVFNKLKLPKEGAFLDLGCGKGRTLIIAAEYGFTYIIGVEFSNLLCQVAKTNLARYTQAHPGSVECLVLHADAAEYAIPKSVNTIFLFNPFDEVIMARVIGNIEESLRSHPRRLYVIYRHPQHRHLFDTSEVFQVLTEYSFAQCNYLVYVTTGN
jgi:SAM-dependent methyltransferase